MPWTEITRPHYERKCARYASDLWDRREIVNALLYLAAAGSAWRLLPKDLPPFSTVQKYFYRWRDDGLLETINHHLLLAARQAAGRAASPTAGVIDSQSVKTTESGGPRGFDAGKKVKGRKRHLLTDTEGFLVAAVVHAADIQDRDGAPAVLAEARLRFPWLRHVFADSAYAGDKLKRALKKIATGPSKSSAAPTARGASKSSPDDGSSSAPSPGSAARAASPRTGSGPLRAPSPGSSSPASEGSQGFVLEPVFMRRL